MSKKNGEFAIANVLPGKLNALVKNLMRMMGISDPIEAVRRINAGEWIVSTVVNYITGVYTIFVDETKTVEELAKAGRIDSIDGRVNSSNFPQNSCMFTGQREVTLFHFKKAMNLIQIIAEMDKADCKPATIWYLLSLAIKEPDLQRKFPIFALGSLFKDRAACLGTSVTDGRSIHIYRCDCGFDKNCRFLGMPK